MKRLVHSALDKHKKKTIIQHKQVSWKKKNFFTIATLVRTFYFLCHFYTSNIPIKEEIMVAKRILADVYFA